jgi:hypothetical protein
MVSRIADLSVSCLVTWPKCRVPEVGTVWLGLMKVVKSTLYAEDKENRCSKVNRRTGNLSTSNYGEVNRLE